MLFTDSIMTFCFNLNIKTHMLNSLNILIVLNTQIYYVLISNTLKTNCVINSASSLVYFGVDHRIPLLILPMFNSMILIEGRQQNTLGLLCQKTPEIQAHPKIF